MSQFFKVNLSLLYIHPIGSVSLESPTNTVVITASERKRKGFLQGLVDAVLKVIGWPVT